MANFPYETSRNKKLFTKKMPKVSARKQILEQIDKLLFHLIIFSNSNENVGEIEELMELKAHILSFRYFSNSVPIPKSLEHRVLLLTLPSNEFRQAFRMNKDTFSFILNTIENHPIFNTTNPHKQQPVWIQLLLALERFGFDGNACSIGKVARNLGVGNGTVVLYTNWGFQSFTNLKFLRGKFAVWLSMFRLH